MSPAAIILLGIAIATANDAKTAPPQPGTVRVAVVNVGHVFNKFHKAEKFKHDLEVAAKPYNDKAKAIQDDIKKWDASIATKEYGRSTKEEIEEKLVSAKRQLEDLAKDMRKKLGKQSENNLVELWKEMQAAIDEYAAKHGIELVLGYGDPLDKKLMDLFPNVNRKMNAMDAGGAVPLFMARRADISEQIANVLNKHTSSSSPAVDVRNLPAPHTTKSKTFDLPVRMDEEFRKTLSEVRLYSKTPGTPWFMEHSAGPNVERFTCKVPTDGEYWYLLATVDKKGQETPSSTKDWIPHQRVIVKTAVEPPPLLLPQPPPVTLPSDVPPSPIAPMGPALPPRTPVPLPPLPPFPLPPPPPLLPSPDGEAKQTVKGGFAPLTLPPTSAEFMSRGEALWQQGKHADALKEFGEAIRLSPKDARPLRMRGHVWLAKRDYDKAVADYTNALAIAPKDTEALVGRALVRFRSRDFEQAIVDLDAAIKVDPKNGETFLARAMVRNAMSNTRGAIADLDVSLRLDASDAQIHFLRGKLHGEVGDYQKAIADFTTYIERHPNDGRGYGMRALAYFAIGETQRGILDAAKASE